jgi:hypothetical protein
MQFFVGYQTGRTDIVTSSEPHHRGAALVDLLGRPSGDRQPDSPGAPDLRPKKPEGGGDGQLPDFRTFIAVRYNFIIPDLAVYKLEGLEFVFRHARLSTDYVPNLNEWLVRCGSSRSVCWPFCWEPVICRS